MPGLSFSGRPPLGSATYSGSSKIPPTSGGTVASDGFNYPGKGYFGQWGAGAQYAHWLRQLSRFQRELQRYGGAYAALGRIDPARSRRKFRQYDALLEQYMPSFLRDDPWGWEKFAQWASQGYQVADTSNYPFGRIVPAGWTLTCDVTPPILETSRKMMTAPVPSTLGATCNVSTTARANQPWGSDVPAGSTVVSLVCSSAASPWPNANGRPYWVITHPSSPAAPAIKFGVGTIVLPMPFSDPEPAQAVEVGGQEAVRGAFGLRVAPMTGFEFPSMGPPSKTPDGGYTDSPPPPRTRERKWKLGKGGAIGELFGAYTEVMDAMDCAVSAIKKNKSRDHSRYGRQLYGKSKGLWNKSRFIADNFDVSNAAMVGDFIYCMAQNEITDRVIGTVSSKAGKAYGEASGAPRGPTVKRPPPVPSDLLNSGQSWF